MFDSELGAYVVVGHPGYFYYDGVFLRLDGGLWQASVGLEGPWRSRSLRSVPPGLRAKVHAKRKKHPTPGHGPAKHAW